MGARRLRRRGGGAACLRQAGPRPLAPGGGAPRHGAAEPEAAQPGPPLAAPPQPREPPARADERDGAVRGLPARLTAPLAVPRCRGICRRGIPFHLAPSAVSIPAGCAWKREAPL